MSVWIAIAMGGLGLRFSRLGAMRKASSGGGGSPSFPDDTTSANEYLILFI